MTTTQQVHAAINMVAAIAEAIRSLGEVPSGVLYAQVFGHMTIDQYTQVIGIVKRVGLVAETNNVLRWVGPTLEEK